MVSVPHKTLELAQLNYPKLEQPGTKEYKTRVLVKIQKTVFVAAGVFISHKIW